MTKENNEVSDAIINAIASHLVESKKQGLEITPYRLKRLIATHVDDISEYPGNVNELYSAIFERLTTELVEQATQEVISFDITQTTYPDESVRTSDTATGLVFSAYKNKPKETPLESLSIQWEENKNISITRNLEPEDREVHDAIMTLFDAGNRVVTTQTIYRTMTANPKAKLTDNMRDRIMNSILKLSGAIVVIEGKNEPENDNDEEMIKRYPKVKGLICRENIIYTRSVTAEHKGKLIDAIEILSKPVLLSYAEKESGTRNGRINRTPMELLNTPVRKDMENIVIQGFLQRRIKMFSQGRTTPNVLLEDIYSLIDFSNFENERTIRNKKSKVVRVVSDILDYWKEHSFIADYEFILEGRTKRAIKIIQ